MAVMTTTILCACIAALVALAGCNPPAELPLCRDAKHKIDSKGMCK